MIYYEMEVRRILADMVKHNVAGAKVALDKLDVGPMSEAMRTGKKRPDEYVAGLLIGDELAAYAKDVRKALQDKAHDKVHGAAKALERLKGNGDEAMREAMRAGVSASECAAGLASSEA
jgi:hypothetical protein